MEFLKTHYKKILLVLFVFIFFNTCTKNCSKSNDLRVIEYKLDSCLKNDILLTDSIIYLNTIIKHKNVELNAKNEQIEQLQKTLSTVINKNAVNNIRVIVPEKTKENEIK